MKKYIKLTSKIINIVTLNSTISNNYFNFYFFGKSRKWVINLEKIGKIWKKYKIITKN